MKGRFYTNYSEERFIDKLKKNIDHCKSFAFSVSFIKKAGLKLIYSNIDAALSRGAKGKLITSTYQNFTDVESLKLFYELQEKYPGRFECHLDKESFKDVNGNVEGFHSKGYLFEFEDYHELMVGSSNITLYALLKNVEWDLSVVMDDREETYEAACEEFEYLWDRTEALSLELIDNYRTKLYYSIERWDMDYDVANSEVKPNYMQRKALKELNRIRAVGASKALVVSAAGSGKTFLSAFDALNFNPDRLLYIAQEGSILMKSYETFSKVFGSDKSYGIYNGEFKEFDRDFVFATNVTMANNLMFFDKYAFDYIIIDECHHASASTYRKILEYFEPQFLLGITATPERMDGEDVFDLFDHNVPYELRLRDAITNGLVVPFKYYGIRDELVEYSDNSKKGHKFIEQFSDDKHCDFIYKAVEKNRVPGQKLKALAFCRDISHATRMSQAMSEYYNTAYLTGKNTTGERQRTYRDLQSDDAELEMLFTVDLLNEGVDIPGVNMVLFLRPTDSQTVFIQQLGRGLRKYDNKTYVPVIDFIGNDYRRSVQIAFALGNLSENFVVEKRLINDLINDDFRSLGLGEYGVEISLDDLSKKEILSYIDNTNFNRRDFLEQDYKNFKRYIGSQDYPKHVDYLNNDFAPDLTKFMKAKIAGKKNTSYYGFLHAIGDLSAPSFDNRQIDFVNYLSDYLPLVRPHEFLILQKLVQSAGNARKDDLLACLKLHVSNFDLNSFDTALDYLVDSGFVRAIEGLVELVDIELNVDLTDYLFDLFEYGLGKYDVDFSYATYDGPFALWGKYRKEQVQRLLGRNLNDIMKGTKVIDNKVYIYVTVAKGNSIKDDLKYVDGYIDENTFQWETVAHINANELNSLKNSDGCYIFVRKAKEEDGITLPFTYIGTGSMEFIDGSLKQNGAYLFRISMNNTAPEDIFFDFKLPGE